jgi:hypothetical protein
MDLFPDIVIKDHAVTGGVKIVGIQASCQQFGIHVALEVL